MCQAPGMADASAEVMTMARTVKRARDALVESVRRSLHGDRGTVLRGSHTQVFECLDPAGTRLTTLAERARMSHQAMGEMVDELTRHGYLERPGFLVETHWRQFGNTVREENAPKVDDLAGWADQRKLGAPAPTLPSACGRGNYCSFAQVLRSPTPRNPSRSK